MFDRFNGQFELDLRVILILPLDKGTRHPGTILRIDCRKDEADLER